MSTPVPSPTAAPEPGARPARRTVGASAQTRKAALAAFLGSMLEYYDFFIYGSAAALVFPTLFFPSGDPAVGTVSSLATFGVGYAARPLGGIVLGHFGDKVGRKKVMILTLLLMGVSSLVVGLLPTYEQVGIVAPVLLVLARLGQGISAGGEAAGASTLTLEHSPEGRRGFFTSFAMSGTMAGILLANFVFIPVAALPERQLMSWGWRIPFWLSIVMIVLAYLVRRRLDETPVFEAEAAGEELPPLPLAHLFRTQWADVLKVMFASLFAVFQTVFMVFGLAYATSEAVGLDRSTMLWVSVAANAVAVVTVPASAALSDRVGRRPIWVAAALSCAALVPAYFWALTTGSLPLIVLVAVLLNGVAYSGMNGLWPAYFSELFAARVRYSGFAVGSQFGFLLAGFAPAIGFAVMGDGVTGWVPVALFAAACGVVSAVAVLTMRETHKVSLADLGKPLPRR
ncbi:MFS transporter [Streptomyces sp. CL12-4]|uniref:MFS transporter n=1 Tax=Streptomyces sp. CL12-4 TaxID=2810306 RepID=UPI001EFACFC0|nr:MFS transporter [Streptomyces sp. CL12-4]MCG8970342.1 MHS family MFS transporter [Streptomyces sp. CL12-4]